MKSHPVGRPVSITRAWKGIACGNAFTLIELLVVMAIIAILASLSLPALGRAMNKSRQVHCLGQLRQIGIASIAFGQEHNDRLPVQLWTNGCPASNHVHEIIAPGALTRSYCAFLAMSNEVANPRILTCRSDKRKAAPNFQGLRDENVSYAVGLQAALNRPDSIIATDANLAQRGKAVKLDLTQGGVYDLAWTKAVHGLRGNLLFADAHVESRKNLRWMVPAAAPPEAETNSLAQSAVASAPPEATGKDRSSNAPNAWQNFTNGVHELFPTVAFQPQSIPAPTIEAQAARPPKTPKTETFTSKPPDSATAETASPNINPLSNTGNGDADDSEGSHGLLFSISTLILLLLLLWALCLVMGYGFKYWRARRMC